MKTLKVITGITVITVLMAACGGPVGPAGEQIRASELRTILIDDGKTVARPAPAMPGINVPAIKVDTVGFPLGWKKVVIFNVEPTGAVVKNNAGEDILKITGDMITNYGLDQASQDLVWQVDISSLETPGSYTIHAGAHISDPFVIGEYWQVYKKAIVALVKSFYFQRTRTALTLPYAEWEGDHYLREGISHVGPDVGWDYNDYPKKKQKWQTHPDKQWWPGEQIKKGWFDAGNFDMYIPSTGPSAGVLLYAYELHPGLFNDNDQNIPESGNGVPDLLDECTWGLDWIMSMQQKDGSFRHSEAVRAWTSVIPADQDDTARWIRSVSSSATAKGVAVLAQASQIYKTFPPYAEIAGLYAQAARMGWEWLKKNPDHIRVETKGSPQPTWDDDAEYNHNDKGARFAAAAEIWLRFRDVSALAELRKMIFERKLPEVNDAHSITTGSWVNIARYGMIMLARDEQTPEDVKQHAKHIIIKCAADVLIPTIQKDGHFALSSPDDYYWGHNANMAEKIHILAMASKITDDSAQKELFMQGARDNWHWLMGRNPNSYAMATRVGKGVTALYHMEWGPFSPPPPGYAIGGPNATQLSAMAPGAPAKVLIWDNAETTRMGTPAHTLFHWKQEDIWDAGFADEGSWEVGWWEITETDLLYSADFVLAGVAIR